ncbi:hypothetical protein PSGK_09625 [Pseudomonas solani]|uniref:hypothetical protein n=1 Tax=Pseudomonas solani TaxID=2731552 RepID=UPI0035BE8A3F
MTLLELWGKLEISEIITPMLVIIGWALVNRQNNKREERKELRTSINEIREDIEALENLSIEYHTNSCDSNSKSDSILNSLTKLSRKLGHTRLPKESYLNSYISLSECVTSNNFRTRDFKKQTKNSEFISNIKSASQELQDKLEDSFYKTYRLSYFDRTTKFIDRNSNAIFGILAYIGLIILICAIASAINKSICIVNTKLGKIDYCITEQKIPSSQ